MLGNLYWMGPEACPALSPVKRVPDLVLGIRGCSPGICSRCIAYLCVRRMRPDRPPRAQRVQ